MTTSQTTAAAGVVPAARLAPDAHSTVALPGRPFPLGATPGEHLGIAGTNFALAFEPEVLGQDAADPAKPSTLDSAGHVPRSLVADPAFSWQDSNRP
jgi:hypothetical protein